MVENKKTPNFYKTNVLVIIFFIILKNLHTIARQRELTTLKFWPNQFGFYVFCKNSEMYKFGAKMFPLCGQLLRPSKILKISLKKCIKIV